LFDPEHKRPIPFCPRKIGIVTSSTGAVIHDMLTVLERRFSGIPVLFFPAAVQGETAVPTLVEGINHMKHSTQISTA
jgi:exodeoxyribonuclease VII large subunit